MVIILLLLVSVLPASSGDSTATSTTPYQPDWKSLDQRHTPEWFFDAKLGIFVHWGVYSVPSYTRKGGYAEWYYRGYMNRDSSSAVWQFHKRVYGQKFTYQDFAPMFKAELFNPDEWADIFARSGARYIVLTSKHHDGYCLWPSPQRPGWNSADVGPHRDLLGDLTGAVRKRGLRMGLYYSLCEWTNPLNTWDFPRKENDMRRYVDEHMIPQFKDVVNRYRPSIIFSDGEWTYPAKTFRSEDLVAWLYNHPALKDEIVVNDRWGSDTRFKHGGYFATEYTRGLSSSDHPWEECRGLGSSFGYNRNEALGDYISAKDLVHMFIRLVSNGGNLLLNIGPAADGTIPVIMQERLLQLGRWLKANGSAIYATRAWTGREHEGENIRYTRSKDGKVINAISLAWPWQKLILKNVKPVPGSLIHLLGVEEPLAWNFDERSGLVIDVPERLRDHFEGAEEFAYVFSIEGGASALSPPPVMIAERKPLQKERLFVDSVEVQMTSSAEGAQFFYTTDGSEPEFGSSEYKGPVRISHTTTLKAFAYQRGMVRSETCEVRLTATELRKAEHPDHVASGLNCEYYEESLTALPDFSKLKPKKTVIVPLPDLSRRAREENFAFTYTGYIRIPKSGVYSFSLRSDDGSRLMIGGQKVVDNDGLHSSEDEQEGSIALEAGLHRFLLQHFQREGDKSLVLAISGPEMDKHIVPVEMYARDADH